MTWMMVFTSCKCRVTRRGHGWVGVGCWLCSMKPSAVDHFWQLLQKVVLSDAGIHIFVFQMVISEFINQLLEVIHGRGRGGGGDGGGGSAQSSYARSPWLGLSGSLQNWAEYPERVVIYLVAENIASMLYTTHKKFKKGYLTVGRIYRTCKNFTFGGRCRPL